MGGRGRGGGRGAYYKEKYGNKSARGQGRSGGYPDRGGHNFYNDSSRNNSYGDGERIGDDLENTLRGLDRASYGAYKQCVGKWDISSAGFPVNVFIDNVQSDPFAPPSKFRVRVLQDFAQYPNDWLLNCVRKRALCDFLARRIHSLISKGGLDQASGGGGWHGSKGGDIRIDPPSQHVLERSSLVVNKEWVEARLCVNLPAQGRSIEGHKAASLICRELMDVVRVGLLGKSLDHGDVWRHIQSIEDQNSARDQLLSKDLIAFVINGAMLPRASGADDRIMQRGGVPFKSPPELQVTMELPHRGAVTGMGLRKGVTLIVGGGFHGKSTLLEALQVGVYDHVPGDGREFVVCDKSAVKVRAEDGRPVTGLDISPFISNLPQGKDTTNFSSGDASGSTSQAANIMEALEVGCSTLLVDEDTCATNFMMRDERMAQLVESEPITPFLHRVRTLYHDKGVSTILVAGSCGDFFDVADTVIKMQEYACKDVTPQAKEISKQLPCKSNVGTSVSFPKCRTDRKINMSSLHPNGKVKADRDRGILYGNTEIDLSCVEQLVDPSQTRFIMDCLVFIAGSSRGSLTIPFILEQIENNMSTPSLDCPLDVVSPWVGPNGAYTRPRRQEIAAALNRLRNLKTCGLG